MKILNTIKYVLCGCVIMLALPGCTGSAPVLVEAGDGDVLPIVDSVSADETKPAEEGSVFVHVGGAVNSPGLYELPAGSRLYDAVLMAGDFRDDADRDYANLAEILTDGTRYMIYTREETAFMMYEAAGGDDCLSHYTSDGLLDINLATKEELMTLNGIGESKASAIIAYRDEHGAFSDVEGIKQVSGIGDGIYSKISGLITVR